MLLYDWCSRVCLWICGFGQGSFSACVAEINAYLKFQIKMEVQAELVSIENPVEVLFGQCCQRCWRAIVGTCFAIWGLCRWNQIAFIKERIQT